MKRVGRKLAMLILAGFLLLNEGVVAWATTVEDAQEQITDLEKEEARIQKKIKELEKKKGNIVSYIEQLDTTLIELQSEIEVLHEQIATTTQELNDAKEDLKEAITKEQEQYEAMKARIRYMYEYGNDQYMQILLSSESISDLLNRSEYIRAISEYDNNMYDAFKKTTATIAEKRLQIETNLKDLTLMNEKLELEEESVNTLIADKKSELKKQQQQISNANQEQINIQQELEKQEELVEELLEQERLRIEEQKRKEEEAKRLAEQKRKEEEERKRKEEEERKKQEQLEQEQNNQNGNNNGNTGNNENNNGSTEKDSKPEEEQEEPSEDESNPLSNMKWPLSISGRITSYFGKRNSPTAGASSYHKGIDVGAAMGTPILAPAAGEVVTASYNSAAGNYVMIYHGNSTYTVYMHCAQLKVKVGQQVKRGAQIATVGSTGISTGPHLHFGVSVNGSYVDPLKYVKQP